jgi:hypothetical protein
MYATFVLMQMEDLILVDPEKICVSWYKIKIMVKLYCTKSLFYV